MVDIPRIDLQMVESFLTRLAGKDATHVFQTFGNHRSNVGVQPTTSRNIRPKILLGTLTQHAKQLEILNLKESGVFVTINAATGRADKDVTQVRALFADWDDIGTGLPAISACGLIPHLVIESSEGRYHAYWLVNDCSLEEFKPLQKAIADKLGSDPAINNLGRVLRLPGFTHHKYADQPYFQTRTIELRDFEPYPLAKVKQGLGLNLIPAKKNASIVTNDSKPMNNINIIKINSALAAFPITFIDNRENWLRIGMCLHSHNTDLLPVWLAWSKQSSKYDEANAIYTWSSFGSKDGSISIASLFYEAKKFNWIDDTKPSRFELNENGVWFNSINKDGEPQAPEYVCSWLDVLGTTSGTSKQDWGDIFFSQIEAV